MNRKDSKNEYKSCFNTHIRIRKINVKWLKKNKTCRTITGFLDIIINKYKEDYGNVPMRKMPKQ